jgi:PTH2 family peptidyl-tRNA hydrolase
MSEQRKVKQVIVWRKDLKVRAGKFGAQVAHAAMAPIFNMMETDYWNDGTELVELTIPTMEKSPLLLFKEGRFTKIVVGVDNEEQLLDLYEKIKLTKIPVALICDAGLTEFKGVPTNTCIGIGPWWADEIDRFTGNFPLM